MVRRLVAETLRSGEYSMDGSDAHRGLVCLRIKGGVDGTFAPLVRSGALKLSVPGTFPAPPKSARPVLHLEYCSQGVDNATMIVQVCRGWITPL
jgi:hypothetical protein